MSMEGLRHFGTNVMAVAYREGTVMRHDKAFLGVVLIQPIVMLLLFGGALSNEPANVPWAVLDQSHSAVARRLVEEIGATGYFLAPRAVTGYEQGRALLERGSESRWWSSRTTSSATRSAAARSSRCCSTVPIR